MTIIEVDSLTAKRWDEWLIAEGFPTLDQFGLLHRYGYAMPVDAAPIRTDKVAYDIALQWAKWLRSRSAPRSDAACQIGATKRAAKATADAEGR